MLAAAAGPRSLRGRAEAPALRLGEEGPVPMSCPDVAELGASAAVRGAGVCRSHPRIRACHPDELSGKKENETPVCGFRKKQN